MILTLDIPDEVAAELGDSEQAVGERVKASLAVHFYETGVVSAGRAAELSGLSRAAFEALLGSSGSIRNYSSEDLDADLAWARRG